MVSKAVSLWSSHKALICVHCLMIYITFVCNVLQIKKLKQGFHKLIQNCPVKSTAHCLPTLFHHKQRKTLRLSAGEIFPGLSSSCPVLLFSFCCHLHHECVPTFFSSVETPGQLLQYLKRSQFGRPVCLCYHGSQRQQACIGCHQISNPR